MADTTYDLSCMPCCPLAPCPCDGGAGHLPKTLYATFEPLSGSCFSPFTVPMTWVPSGDTYACFGGDLNTMWIGEISLPAGLDTVSGTGIVPCTTTTHPPTIIFMTCAFGANVHLRDCTFGYNEPPTTLVSSDTNCDTFEIVIKTNPTDLFNNFRCGGACIAVKITITP